MSDLLVDRLAALKSLLLRGNCRHVTSTGKAWRITDSADLGFHVAIHATTVAATTNGEWHCFTCATLKMRLEKSKLRALIAFSAEVNWPSSCWSCSDEGNAEA